MTADDRERAASAPDTDAAFAPEAPPPAPELEPPAHGLTPDGRLRSGRLAGMTMRQAIWTLSAPIFVESLLNSLVGLTDTTLAAGLPDGGAATDAIGGATYVLWFIGLVVAALGVGSTALISRAIGAGRIAAANAAIGQTLLLATISGAAVGVGLALIAGPTSRLLHLTPAANDAFRTFLVINAAGVPAMTILFSGIACARGAGESVRPLYAMVAVNIVNLIASWMFSGVDLGTTRLVDGDIVRTILISNPFEFNLGIRGIACGTLVAHTVGAVMILLLLRRGVGGARLVRRRLRPHRVTMARLFRLAWPNFLETFGMWIGNFVIILFVGWMSSSSGGLLGAHMVAARIEAISFLPGFAMGVSAATLVGQYLGAGSPAFAARAVWGCTAIASVSMTATGIVFMLIPRTLVGLLSSQPVHLEQTPTVLFIAGAVQLPFAISIVIRSAIRGAGDVRAAMWITWVTTYGVRLPLAWLLCGVDLPLPGGGSIPNPSPYQGGLAGLWIGLCAEVVVRCVVLLFRFFGGKWKRARV